MIRGRAGPLTIVAKEQLPGKERVYNLTVEGEHVYYVSELGLLTHNNCDRIAALRAQGFQEHHIISDSNLLTKDHELLKLAGFDLQWRKNKMFLPNETKVYPTRSIHNERHLATVSSNLAEQMNEIVRIGTQQGFTQAQYDQALRALISQERQLLRSGKRVLNKNFRPEEF